MRRMAITPYLTVFLLLSSLNSLHGQVAAPVAGFSLPQDSTAKKKVPKPIRLDSVLLEQELEVDQLIFNETLSKGGNDFYDLVYTNWTWPVGLKGSYSIIISERPALGRITVVEIFVNEIKVFENFLQPRYDLLEELSRNAIGAIDEAITNYYEIVKELSAKDLLGSGIY